MTTDQLVRLEMDRRILASLIRFTRSPQSGLFAGLPEHEIAMSHGLDICSAASALRRLECDGLAGEVQPDPSDKENRRWRAEQLALLIWPDGIPTP